MAARYVESEKEDSPEYRTLRVNLVDICECISDIERFSMELLDNGLISDASYLVSLDRSIPAASMVAILVSEVMDRVRDSPANFRKFVSILEFSNEDLALTLRHTYIMSTSHMHRSRPSELESDEMYPGPVPQPLICQAKRSRSKPSPILGVRTKEKYRRLRLDRLKIISSPNSLPTTYQLPLCYQLKGKMVAKAVIGKRIRHTAHLPHKVLMLVGATGAGKSTLIDAMANYIMGVDWEDEYRFKLIHEETDHDQSMSQTMRITAYTFYKQEGSPLPYTLTVIDTPGFGGTEGLERDKEIVVQIKALFCDKGIDQLHGIGFVTQAPQARLTQTQRYVFDSILSVFGKDVADNIFLMVTFADGMRPPVLDAARAAGVPFSCHFRFNNSALFASNQAGDEFDAMFWKMGVESFRQFFDELSEAESQSLQQSREVLEEREQLEITMQALQPQIQARLDKMSELQHERELLRKYECVLHDTKDFTFQVLVTKQRQVDIPPGQYTTTCLNCRHTCHYPCPYPSSKLKCRTMKNRGFMEATCRVCPGKCSWEDHTHIPCKFEVYQETEMRTSDELKAMYKSAMTNKRQVETKMMKMEEELDEINTAILQEIDQSKQSSQLLHEIALKSDPLTEVDYIDVLIESEKQEARPGWSQRVKALEDVRKQAEILSTFLEYDKNDLSEDFWSRLKL